MSEPERIVEAAVAILCPVRDMEGLRVLVTAGPTVERIDPVRYLTNDSSGKMGYALAEAARDRGARVTLVSGPVSLPKPYGVEVAPITSTQDLYEAMTARSGEQDLIAQAAAPADYRIAAPAAQKIKKQSGQPLTLELVENPDVARAVGERKRQGQVLIGFAAETQEVLANARKKLESKHLDMIVANDVTQAGAGFGTDTNIAVLVTAKGEERCPLMSKRALADKIWDEALRLRIG
jgi:phosphopantothenoylcysteine decarboxylase/phosphopantothenate--cysteine ligase